MSKIRGLKVHTALVRIMLECEQEVSYLCIYNAL